MTIEENIAKVRANRECLSQHEIDDAQLEIINDNSESIGGDGNEYLTALIENANIAPILARELERITGSHRDEVRGFRRNTFHDSKGIECSIQESSEMEGSFIWLGVHDAKPVHGAPWKPYALPGDVFFSTRMHLNQGTGEVQAS